MIRTLLAKIAHIFTKHDAAKSLGRSFLSFQGTGDVIRAEKLLQKAGFSVSVMGPPPWLQTGCDMVLVCDSVQEPAIRRLLDSSSLTPEAVYPMSDGMLEPVSLVCVCDLGDWFMVKAANMKITVARKSGCIVNVSGGGCPDVPYLASLLIGQSIATSEEPKVRGQTLCSYALQKAFEEARSYWIRKDHG